MPFMAFAHTTITSPYGTDEIVLIPKLIEEHKFKIARINLAKKDTVDSRMVIVEKTVNGIPCLNHSNLKFLLSRI